MNEWIWLFFLLGIIAGMLIGFILTMYLWERSDRKK